MFVLCVLCDDEKTDRDERKTLAFALNMLAADGPKKITPVLFSEARTQKTSIYGSKRLICQVSKQMRSLKLGQSKAIPKTSDSQILLQWTW